MTEAPIKKIQLTEIAGWDYMDASIHTRHQVMQALQGQGPKLLSEMQMPEYVYALDRKIPTRDDAVLQEIIEENIAAGDAKIKQLYSRSWEKALIMQLKENDIEGKDVLAFFKMWKKTPFLEVDATNLDEIKISLTPIGLAMAALHTQNIVDQRTPGEVQKSAHSDWYFDNRFIKAVINAEAGVKIGIKAHEIG